MDYLHADFSVSPETNSEAFDAWVEECISLAQEKYGFVVEQTEVNVVECASEEVEAENG